MFNKRISIAIVSSGYFPLPPVLGGAVENLVDLIARENEKTNEIDLHVYSCYDENAENMSVLYKNTEYEYIKVPNSVKLLDRCIYFVMKNILRKRKHLSYRYIVQRIYYIEQVSKSLSKKSFDRIIIENHMTLLSTMRRKKNYKKYLGKYYYHSHNVITSDFGNKDLLKNCKAIISVSEFISSKIKKHLGNECNAEFRILKNRVDQSRFRNVDPHKAKELRYKYGIDTDEIVLMFTGRLTAEKGVLELLKAYEKSDNENTRLIICGGYYFGSKMKSDYESELIRYSRRLNEKIIFTGFIDYNDMPYYYNMADIIVAPSIWDEPALLAGIEAITVGKPLITTNAGGIPEYTDSQSSFVIDRNSNVVDGLVYAINSLVGDCELRGFYAQKAGEISRNWTKESYYEDFLKVIDISYDNLRKTKGN